MASSGTGALPDCLPESLTSRVPGDIFYEVFSHLPRKTLLAFRTVNRQLGAIATTHAFRHVHLGAQQEKAQHELLVNVAQSDRLRHLVRELTCNTWLGDGFSYNANEEYRPPSDFVNTLPYLRCLPNLRALHLVFVKYCGHQTDDFLDTDIEESTDFRYRVLDTVFRSVAGTWSPEQQEEIDADLDIHEFEPVYDQAIPRNDASGPLPLQTLTISNLADYHDKRLTKSDAFQTVLASKTLTNVQLQMATKVDEAAPELEFHHPEKYDMFESIPSTWLAPAVADTLTTLSLYCREYWGWCPKMDLRTIGTAGDSGLVLPNLQVLALGKYVFSQEWQAGWLASIGRGNGRDGLRELYLDDCPIMCHSRIDLPPRTTADVGAVAAQEGLTAALAKGYPTGRGRSNTQETTYPLRWHTVLSRWRDAMTGLRVFRMGCGALTRPLVLHGLFWDAVPEKTADGGDGYLSIHHRAFRSFDGPVPPPDDTPEDEIDMERYADGAGLSMDRQYTLQYAYFGGIDTLLLDPKRPGGYGEPEMDDTAREDEEALGALYAAVDARARRG